MLSVLQSNEAHRVPDIEKAAELSRMVAKSHSANAISMYRKTHIMFVPANQLQRYSKTNRVFQKFNTLSRERTVSACSRLLTHANAHKLVPPNASLTSDIKLLNHRLQFFLLQAFA